VGFIFGAVAFLSLIFTYFCVPECKGKTLEQVDWLFKNGVRLRDFGKTDASGMLGGGPTGPKEADIEVTCKTPEEYVQQRKELSP
jgi:hypothetical protein